ncbi:extensin family protein [Allomesorhizobium camelthorni]|uniref:Extensin n=1 Tax=Allomesorhizobium camelthorni TaxID=475069 RepID=A0A6G4WK05_9HYPH|nr:extensin family protein [Mesorhizobium camelthorni]NGO54417.1 extensin [Mesorhizobium camelthorni]
MGQSLPRARALWCGGALILLAALSACTTDDVMSLRPDVDVGAQTAAVPARGLQSLVPSNPMMTAYPRFNEPAPPTITMSADETACRRDLKKLGVQFRSLAPIDDGGACRIDFPVEVSAIGSAEMKPAATLSCAMAATFARWTRKELVPSARWRYLSGVKTIHQGSSYSCRNIRGSRGKPSQHSVGNALDIMRIELNNGKDIDVRKPGWFAFRQRGFLNNVRADGCDYFTTVLGPGYDYDHRNHFHFDIMPRKNGYVACK